MLMHIKNSAEQFRQLSLQKLGVEMTSGTEIGSQGITDGGGTKDGGMVANHASAPISGTTTVEHGKLLLLVVLPLQVSRPRNK